MFSIGKYKIADLPKDIVAGIVVAALSMPIAMGYAEIAGMPPIYGLYASIVAPIVYGLLTKTRNIVFGMDSAASAVTGSMIVSMGIALGSAQAIASMPLISLFAAGFLLLFALLRVGRLVDYVPTPVMHGFVAGISLSVILGQIPKMLEIQLPQSSNQLEKLFNVIVSLPQANLYAAALSASALVLIVFLRKFCPKAPAPLMALALGTAAVAALSMDTLGISVLGEVPSGLPMPSLPDFQSLDMVGCALSGAVIALVITLESLLCLETFSMQDAEEFSGTRELVSFGIANAAGALLSCPPASASISRTAAGRSSGSVSQLSSIVAGLIILAVVLFLSPLLYYMPQPILCAIVALALVDVVDMAKVRTYAGHMRLELAVFSMAALIVFLFGALPGVAAGIVLSAAVRYYRSKRKGQEALLGIVEDPLSLAFSDDDEDRSAGEPEISYIVRSLPENLTFLNAKSHISKMEYDIDEDTDAVILDISGVKSIDATAEELLSTFMHRVESAGNSVFIVRSMGATDDSYTRYALRRLIGKAPSYASVDAAVDALRAEFAEDEPECPDAPASGSADEKAGESLISARPLFDIHDKTVPVLSVKKHRDSEGFLVGNLVYLKDDEAVDFKARLSDAPGEYPFDVLELVHSRSGCLLASYEHGKWRVFIEPDDLYNALDAITAWIESRPSGNTAFFRAPQAPGTRDGKGNKP